jgi:hypothetical protein
VFEGEENQVNDLIEAANGVKISYEQLVIRMSYVLGDSNVSKFFIDKIYEKKKFDKSLDNKLSLSELIEEYLFAWEVAQATQIKKAIKKLKSLNDSQSIYKEILVSLQLSSKNIIVEYPAIPEAVTLSSLKKYFFSIHQPSLL